MDNERCHVSETCGSCVPSTRTGHDSRKTTHAHRPRASHRHRRRRCRVVARIARRQCATRACVRFARRPRTRSSARYPSPPFSPTVARARRRAQRRGRKPRVDRRHRPTATTDDEHDDEDESIRTQGRRYGTRGASRRERDDGARGGDFARRARPGAGVNDDRDRGVTRVVCVRHPVVCTRHTWGGGARGDAAYVMFSARRYPCDA